MLIKHYRFKSYLNAMHSVQFNNNISPIHPHTWEIVFYVRNQEDALVQFSEIEKKIELYLTIYEGQYLNEIAPFEHIAPTLENLGDVFTRQLMNMLHNNGWTLLQLEISENPSRSYIIKIEPMEKVNAAVEQKEKENTPQEVKLSEPLLSEKIGSNDSNAIETNTPDLTPPVNNAMLQTEATPIEKPTKGSILEPNIPTLKQNLEPPADPKPQNTDITDTVVQNMNAVAAAQAVLGENIVFKKPEKPEKQEKQEDSPIDYATLFAPLQREERNQSEWLQAFGGKWLLFASLFTLFTVFSFLLLSYINRRGLFPWGSDTMGHLFKAHVLYEQFTKGNIFPLYIPDWYNGLQLFRYWAPFPYYVLLVGELLTKGKTEWAYQFFLVFVFFVGAGGWILWGYRTKRMLLAVVLGVLWFALPDNIRVLFSEGNIPRVTITTLLPYLMFFLWEYIEYKKKWAMFAYIAIMMLVTLSHAMITAMLAITLFIFLAAYVFATRNWLRSLEILGATVISMLLCGIWLYPALQGGLMSLDSSAVSSVMQDLTFPFTQSLNPFTRLSNIEVYYFGLSFLVIAMLGLFFGNKKSFPGFFVIVVVFLGTTKSLLPILVKLPMSQLLWMMRFTSLALGMFFVSLFVWNTVKKKALVFILAFIALDSLLSFGKLAFNVPLSSELYDTVKSGVQVASQRVAVLDGSEFGSFPSYFVSRNGTKNVSQVFGWAWQGASTATNIVGLNTALDKINYPYLFDRTLDLGADTIIVKSSKVKNIDYLNQSAALVGYKLVDQTNLAYVYKIDSPEQFGTTVKYDGVAIGKYAANLSYIFPTTEVSNKLYLDDHTVKELSQYKYLFLSGFKVRQKQAAENLITQLADSGTKVLIDLTNAETDLLTTRASFLGVTAQPVKFQNKYPKLNFEEKEYEAKSFSEAFSQWNTIYLDNLDSVKGYSMLDDQKLPFWGTRYHQNIVFLGFNLAFYAQESKDEQVLSWFEKEIGIAKNTLPLRKIVPIEVKQEQNTLHILAPEENVNTSLASLDAFKTQNGLTYTKNNLLYLGSKEAVLQITYPYLLGGVAVSGLGLLLLAMLILYLYKYREKLKLQEMES